MNNKLSELSKPVAYDYQIAGACIADGNDKKWVDWNNELTHEFPPDWMVEDGKVTGIKRLYSQEYVSALLADSEAKDKRIAELERITEGVDQLAIDGGWTARGMSEYAKSLEAYNARLRDYNAGLAQESCDLKAKLATPVRLEKADSSIAPITRHSFNAAVDYCAKAVRAAGFTVEGDE